MTAELLARMVAEIAPLLMVAGWALYADQRAKEALGRVKRLEDKLDRMRHDASPSGHTIKGQDLGKMLTKDPMMRRVRGLESGTTEPTARPWLEAAGWDKETREATAIVICIVVLVVALGLVTTFFGFPGLLGGLTALWVMSLFLPSTPPKPRLVGELPVRIGDVDEFGCPIEEDPLLREFRDLEKEVARRGRVELCREHGHQAIVEEFGGRRHCLSCGESLKYGEA